MKINLLFFLSLFSSSFIFAQLPALDFKAYDTWKRVEKEQLSPNGKLLTYEQTVLRGNTELHIYFSESQKHDSMLRAKDALIAPDESFVAWTKSPDYDTLRKLELNKIDKKKWPKDSLFIYHVAKDSLIKISKLKQRQLAEEAPVLAVLHEVAAPKIEKVEPSKWDKLLFWKKEPTAPIANPFKTDGFRLEIYQQDKIQTAFLDSITQFALSPDGTKIAVIQQRKAKLDSMEVKIYQTANLSLMKAFETQPMVQDLTWSSNSQQLAFLFSTDTTKIKNYKLALYKLSSQETNIFGDSLDFEKTPKGDFQQVAAGRAPKFSHDGNYLFFGVAARQFEQKDTLTESEKVNLDIWHYQDTRLQAQQLLRKGQDLKKSTLYAYNLNTQRLQKLGSDSLDIQLDPKKVGAYLLATNPNPYLIEAQWKAPNKADFYRIEIETGKSTLIGKALAYTGELSADGRYFSYYTSSGQKWILLDIEKQSSVCMNCTRKDIRWEEDLNGQPMEAGPIGFIGYGKNAESVYFQSEFDCWAYEVASKKLVSLSNEMANKEKIELRFERFNYDSLWVTLEEGYFIGLRKSNKNELLYAYTQNGGLSLQFEGAQRIASLGKAEKSNIYMLRKMDVATYPDLILVKDANWNQGQRISVANPQQQKYNWATVELVSWKALDGQQLQGLLYKPANYDPTKQYPLLFYYYELNSDNLHNYQAPKPSASIINPTEYASGGYLVFVPDIRYEPGKPAKGAYNAIMSATDHLLKIYPIDSKRMGLQGQSWGGYQTAMLITMTNRYAAAMAGAPVGNMFSAYGGIRWGSGLNRQFQYESTQSRIGATIWEKPELYIENSPLFHLPKVQTPLLIMANDQDGAVPWYQGLELYNGMRRLGKPCWMLNYNADDHNLTKLSNKYDLSIRMRQFFDHYLMNAAAPSWMTNGIPAVDKGKVTGY
jgi:dipeptidyl aminopeptidase/acylaminoacyl peptidase